METDATRMCALLVGLPDVRVVGVGEWPQWLRIVIATDARAAVVLRTAGASSRCPRGRCWSICRCSAGRPGWCGASSDGVARRAAGRWTEQDPRIASARCALTTRAARWATVQVGRHGRSVAEVADDLSSDWHTVMDAVVVFGAPVDRRPGPLRHRDARRVGRDLVRP